MLAILESILYFIIKTLYLKYKMLRIIFSIDIILKVLLKLT